MPPRFPYLRDPLFLAALLLFLVNRWVLEPGLGWRFLHAHLNDLICLPLFVPLILWSLRRLGWRADDAPPRPVEVLAPFVIFAVVFEAILPAWEPFRGRAHADPDDVTCYALGALGGCLWWRWRYRSRSLTGPANSAPGEPPS